MKITKFLFTSIIFAAIPLFAGSSYIGGGNPSSGSNDLINYYNDGVYDTISQINKEIEEGVNEEELKDIIGKIAVVTPLQNVSTVNLIFYKTTAAKINLFNAMTVKDENGIPYLLWDLKQRDVDAQYVIQKLTERNIPASSKLVSNGSKFYREPVLIKDFIDKVKYNIKNLNTKVVVIENKEYVKDEKIKVFPPVEIAEKTIYKQDTPTVKDNPVNMPKEEVFNATSFQNNTNEVSKNLRVGKTGAIFYKISKVAKGVKLGDFTVAELKLEETDSFIKYFITYVEDKSNSDYLLYIHKKETKTIVEAEHKTTKSTEQKEKTSDIKTTKNISKYKCNFKNIKMALTKDGKVTKIDSDSLYYNKVVTVEAINKIDKNYLLTNSIGLPEILLNEKYINDSKYCSKAN